MIRRSGSSTKDLFWSLVATTALAASQWFCLIVIARLGELAQLGFYSLALAITGPPVMLARLNMRAVMVTDVSQNFQFADYFTARLFLSISVVVAALAYVAGTGLNLAAGAVLVAVAVYKCLESIADLLYGVLQKSGQYSAAGIATVIRGAALVASVALALYAGGTLSIGIGLASLASLVVLLTFDRRAVRPFTKEQPSASVPSVLRLIRVCMPTGIVMVLASVTTNLPVYFIQHSHTIEEVGLYSAVAWFLAIGGILGSVIAQVSAGPMSEYYATQRDVFARELYRLLLLSALIGVAVVAVAAAFGRSFLLIVYGHEYASEGNVLLWIAAASALSMPAALLGMSLTVARKFMTELLLTVCGLAVVSLVAWVTVPVHGSLGGAWALCSGLLARVMLGGWAIAATLAGSPRSPARS